MDGVIIMSDKWLYVVDLADRADLPESTTRRYITRFDAFFRSDDKARGRRYHPDSIAILKRIKSLYDAGSQTDEISDILSGEFPMVITKGEEEQQVPPPVAPYATKEDIQTLYAVLEELMTEVEASKEKDDWDEQDKLRRKVIELQEEIKQKEREIKELENKKPWWKFF